MPLSSPDTIPNSQTLPKVSSIHCATSPNTPVSVTTPIASMIPITNSICCRLPYCTDLGVSRCCIWSALISLRFITSLTTHSTLSTQSAPRNGLSFVMLWNVGMNHSPPMPTNSISTLCHGSSLVSSPRNGIGAHWVSSRSGNCLFISIVGTIHASSTGRAIYAVYLDAVIAPSPHSTSVVGSPITVRHPPQLAAITIAAPISILCRRLCTIECIITSIMVAVVRLSRFADRMNVASVIVHNRRLGLRVLIHLVTKSKHPLLCRISTMLMVASRNITILAARPT